MPPEREPIPAITGVGAAFPPRVVTNMEISEQIAAASLNLTPPKILNPKAVERILRPVGVVTRRWVERGKESTSDLAIVALREALGMAGIEPKTLRTIVVATSTPDYIGVPVSAALQNALGIDPMQVRGYDIAAACNGFLQALYGGMLEMTSPYGHGGPSGIVGADILSLSIDPRRSEIYPLLGDAAGAVILENTVPDHGAPIQIGFAFGADGEYPERLAAPAGGSKNPLTPDLLASGGFSVHMDGTYVKDRAIAMMAAMTRKALERARVPLEEIALFIPHQANLQIIRGVADSLNFPMERVMVTIDRYGNTSAASIPTALKVAIDEGKIGRNQFLAMAAFGAGLNFGAAVIPMVGLPKK